MIHPLKIFLVLVILGALSVGFRPTNKGRWDLSPENPTLYLRVDPEQLIKGVAEDDYPLDHPVLSGVPKEDQLRAIMAEVMREISSIPYSYLRLEFYPLPGSEEEETFDPAAAENRTIDVDLDYVSEGGSSTGLGELILDGTTQVGCRLGVVPSERKSATSFQWIFGHELMHCLGLMHHHADTDCYLSYASRPGHYRLGIDEKQALIYLYPAKLEYGNETPTLGLACQPSSSS